MLSTHATLRPRLADAALHHAFAWALALALLAAPASAFAVPRFAVRTGTACATCHVNPSGGGMRNRFGRNVFAPTRLTSPWNAGRAVSPLFDGDLTDSLAFGADARVAALYGRPRDPQPTTFSFFLMQADAYFAATPTDRLTFYVDLGFYGSSEAMIMWRHASGLYFKAGRFMPAYGLRLDNHTAFIRQDIGFGPRGKDVGFEVGFLRGPLHLQVAALNGSSKADAQLDENWQKALLARAELVRRGRVLNLMGGASGAYNISGTDVTAVDSRAGEIKSGGFVGAGLGRLAYLGEADIVMTRAFSDYKWTRRYVSYQEVALLVLRGLDLTFNWEYHDPDLRYGDNAFHRFLVGFEFFPVPNVEVKAFYRHVLAHTDNPLAGLDEAFVALHLYL